MPTLLLGFLIYWTWGISSWLIQQSTVAVLALYMGYLLTAFAPDLGCGVSPLCCSLLQAVQPQLDACTWMQSQNDRVIHFQGKPINIMVIQIYAPTSNAEEDEVEWFYENLPDFLE